MFRLVAAVRKLIQQQRADRIFEKYANDCFGLSEENARKLLCDKGMSTRHITVNQWKNADFATIDLIIHKDGIVCALSRGHYYAIAENHVTPDLFVAQCKACIGMAEAAAVEHVKQQGYTNIIVEDCELFHNLVLHMNTVYINVLKGTVVKIMYNLTTYPEK